MIVCGDAADGIGDSMYEGTVYVRRHASPSLGADCVEAELTGEDRALLARRAVRAARHRLRRARLEEARVGPQAVELLRKHEYDAWRAAL